MLVAMTMLLLNKKGFSLASPILGRALQIYRRSVMGPSSSAAMETFRGSQLERLTGTRCRGGAYQLSHLTSRAHMPGHQEVWQL